MIETDQRFIRRCFELALKGKGKVRHNPLVGAVIADGDDVVGEGYHAEFGGEHAEIKALKQAGSRASGATLYVNLEPCNHFGNTPPCTRTIIDAGITRVVFAVKDPNPTVIGDGEKLLTENGITVETGLLENEAERLNEKFLFSMRSRQPFVTLKIAQTLDGYIADLHKHSKWITGSAARESVQALRSEHDAVLLGAGTINNDNPSLTIREESGHQPYRIIIDGRLSTTIDSSVYTDQFKGRTIVITSDRNASSDKFRQFHEKGIDCIMLEAEDGLIPLRSILPVLWERNINSVLVEGGGSVFSQFLEGGLFSRVVVYISPRFLINGTRSVSGSGIPLESAEILHSVMFGRTGDDMIVAGVSELYKKYLPLA
jgi:diaminohydroxyphosphoribosylaminopyrimidine deaminase / 5-amino-6-(5-phosphoribosylamino)uracil reductase